MGLLELIVVILLLLWLFGYFGRGRFYMREPLTGPSPFYGGNLIHLILVLVVILIILRLLGLA
ncbi:MAG TPA: DUF5670 family protein [Candidatus Limnocylindria bacterium]